MGFVRTQVTTRKFALAARASVAFLVLLASEGAAFAWGATGHRAISEAAIRGLPSDIPAFLRTDDAVRFIGEVAREPDRSKGSGPPMDIDNNPGHYINLSDDLKVSGINFAGGGKVTVGPPFTPLPDTREAFDTLLRASNLTQYRTGYLPYSILDGWQQVKVGFAYWRADTAAMRFAKTDAARHWLDEDRALHERLAIRDVAYWSHFVADASQPLHVTVHANGWGDLPNPENFTTANTLHAQFEGAFVRANVSEADISKAMMPFRDCSCAMPERVVTYIAATHAQVLPLYRLDNAHAFDANSAEGKAFVVTRLAAGASELRDMIVMAWTASEDNSVGFPALKVRDIEAGSIDPLGNLQGLD